MRHFFSLIPDDDNFKWKFKVYHFADGGTKAIIDFNSDYLYDSRYEALEEARGWLEEAGIDAKQVG